MKINNISIFKYTNTYTHKPNNCQNNNQTQIKSTPQYATLPSTAQYLSFMGGYSLNLGQTVERLDKLAEKSEIYPPNIREWLGMILESGNKENDTLISAHKKYFSSLEDCFSLAKIKENFPEFKDVISAFDVETEKGKDSFLRKFQKGELEYFDNDEDLTVQLIKLYWGKGFSLPDLRKYAGTDLFHTMRKLKIPTASRDYGHILKISDPVYNERLTAEMTEKRLAALDRKAQERDGEVVYIPRHYSAERGQRISEGLIRHYEEHPEKIYEMSERQKQFYRDNPERAEIFARVVKKAWSIFGADNIKKAMSKFFARNGIKDFNPEINPVNLTKQQSDLMKMFWGQNEWAKKSFSKNMKFAWKKINDEKNYFVELVQIPTGLQRQIRQWARSKGIDISEIQFNTKVFKNDVERNEAEQRKCGEPVNKIIRMFEEDFPNNPDDMANTYYRAVARFCKETLADFRPKTIEDYAFKEYLKKIQDQLFVRIGNQVYSKSFTSEDIHQIYLDAARTCITLDLDRYVKNLNRCLDIEYDVVIRKLNPLIEKLGLE